MALPAYIPVRTVGFRGVIELEQGKGLTAKVAVRSSGSLRWADTGELFETLGGTFTSGRGASVTFPLPVTDDDGWLTTANEIIDVSEGGAYTHTYTATVVVMDASGRQVGDVYEYGPFVVPASESTLWLDELDEQTTTAGSVVARPTVYAVNGQDGDVTITAAGLGAYVKPGTGVPKTDLASAVQTSLGKADSAYQLPEDGVPASDLEEAVQTSLGKADEAVPNTVEGRTALAASPELGAAIVEKVSTDIPDDETDIGAALKATIAGNLTTTPAEPSSTGYLSLAGTEPGEVPVVKPSGDGRAGVWEMTHNDSTGYLFHLLSGAGMGHNAAIVALGVDNDGIGLLVPNKATGRGIVGDQRPTVTAADGYWLHATQRSTLAPLVRLEQQAAGAADVLQLLSFTGNSGNLLYVGDANGQAGAIVGSTGVLDWRRDVQIRNLPTGEVAKYLGVFTSTSANSSNTRRAYHGAAEDVFFGATGSAGIYYPYKVVHSGSSLAFQTAGNVTALESTAPLPSEIGSATTHLQISHANGLLIRGGTIKVDGTGLAFFGGSTRAQKTGWALATGTAKRTTFDTATVTLAELAGVVKALVDDLHATAGYGLIAS